MKLLLDEMYSATVAEQLRARGHDVAAIHDPGYRRLEGAPDVEVFAVAVAEARAVVTENVPDLRRLEAHALARGERHAGLVLTTNRQFPRGDPATTGRLVHALEGLLHTTATLSTAIFLRCRRHRLNRSGSDR